MNTNSHLNPQILIEYVSIYESFKLIFNEFACES